MASYTITTTDEQEAALQWAYQQQIEMSRLPGVSVQPPATVAAFLQQQVDLQVLNVNVVNYNTEQGAELIAMVATVPPANRAAAIEDIEDVVTEHGGTAPFRNVPYLWSTNTAAPPRVSSIEADQTQANMATVSKLTFDDLDADGGMQMAALMAIPAGSTIRVLDPANAANALTVRSTAAAIQRQGADGFVEIAVAFISFSGTFADTQRVVSSAE